MAHNDWILTLNAGSSSLKFAAYDNSGTRVLASGQIAGIGDNAQLQTERATCSIEAPNHGIALEVALDSLIGQSKIGHMPSSVGHRIVHGGERSLPCLITDDVHQEIEQMCSLAPLHNPPALRVIEKLASLFPSIMQIACFDTAFHGTNPAEATTIAIPEKFRDEGIRRYGFHGLSFSSLVRRFKNETGVKLPQKLLAFHLGAGASLAAIVNGKSIATTMGFSPLDGLVMATRGGSIDPGVLVHLMKHHSLSANDLEKMLNKECGLLALSGGENDMKKILEATDKDSEFAVSHYCYWITRHAGSMIAAMGGVDGFVFSGGIGENAKPVREKILHDLLWAGAGAQNSWVIGSDEQGEIAHSVAAICKS